MFFYTKYSAKKSQETERRAPIGKELMEAEKERQNAGRLEETGYSERDEKEYEEGYSNDSDDEE